MGLFSKKPEPKPFSKHLTSALPQFSEAVFAGRLEYFPSIDCLQYVLANRPNGILTFQEISGPLANLYIQEGHLIRATGSSMTNIGEILTRLGAIDKEILKHALRIQEISKGEKPLGAVLIKLGAVKEETIRQAVVVQIQETIAHVLDWKKGLFFFCAMNHRSPDGILVNLMELVIPGTVRDDWVLLEAIRARDEAKAAK